MRIKSKKVIREKVGNSIDAEGDETIERVVGRLLRERGETLAVAESCTGGLIADLLTNVPGSSGYFLCGVVAYSNASKKDLLGVPADLIRRKGAVSASIARSMAEGVRRIARSTYGIGVTGLAGPSGGTPQKPVGTVHIAVAGPDGTKEKGYSLPCDRKSFKLLAAHLALHKLRRMILG